MSRRPRYFFPGATYHVMLRGNNGQQIFESDGERCRLCLLLQEGVERYGHRILAFCFMTNHVHLAVQVDTIPLSKIFQNISFRYTRFCNWRHKAIGHLFQGRFKSVLVDSNRYLKHLIRYIHLNPVRANMVNNPLDYPWSSHRAYLQRSDFCWLTTAEGLRRFGQSRVEAMEAFHGFVQSGIGVTDDLDFDAGCTDGILGDDDFITAIEKRLQESRGQYRHSTDFNTLLSLVTNKYEVNSEVLRRPGLNRMNSHVRAVMALLARDIEGVTLQELADFFGREASGMSKAAVRLEARMRESKELHTNFEGLKRDLLMTSQDI